MMMKNYVPTYEFFNQFSVDEMIPVAFDGLMVRVDRGKNPLRTFHVYDINELRTDVKAPLCRIQIVRGRDGDDVYVLDKVTANETTRRDSDSINFYDLLPGIEVHAKLGCGFGKVVDGYNLGYIQERVRRIQGIYA